MDRSISVITIICFLQVALVQPLFYHPPHQSCPCPLNYDPVCGVDGRTYSNLCDLQCSGVGLAYYGECEQCPPPQIVCIAPPCLVTRCPNFPTARCVNGCNCRARFFIGRQEVTNFCERHGKNYY